MKNEFVQFVLELAFGLLTLAIAALVIWAAIEIGLNLLNSVFAFVAIIIGFAVAVELVQEHFF